MEGKKDFGTGGYDFFPFGIKSSVFHGKLRPRKTGFQLNPEKPENLFTAGERRLMVHGRAGVERLPQRSTEKGFLSRGLGAKCGPFFAKKMDSS